MTNGNETNQWTFADLNGAPPKIVQRRMQPVAGGRACQRTLSAVSHVVIDVEACGLNVTNEGNQTAERMAANVTP